MGNMPSTLGLTPILMLPVGKALLILPPYIQPAADEKLWTSAPLALLVRVIVFPFKFTIPEVIVRILDTVVFPTSDNCPVDENVLFKVRL